ncbi:MAG: MFS transporter [Rhodospirillales bacterium]|nr:MFS transporter [Rhodospirillales bacterium]
MNARPPIAVIPYRWVVFALLGAGYLLVYFHRLSPAVVALEMMDELKADAGLMGLLASAYFYPYALMQIPSGLLSDSWGPRKTITSFFLLAGIGSIAFGAAPSVGWAIAARIGVGVGVAMLFVPTMKVLTSWFKVTEFTFAAGLLMAVGGLGVLSAASPFAYLSTVLGWRESFMIIGVVTLVLAAAIWILVRDTPQEMGLPAIRTNGDGAEEGGPAIGLWQGVRMVIGSARFWPLFAWFFFTFGIFFSFSGLWGGPFLMHVYGLDKLQAGGILSMPAVALIFGCPVIAYISDRVLRSRKKVMVISAVAVVILSLPLAFFPARFNLAQLYAWGLLFGFFGSAIVIIGFTTAKEMFPVRIAGTAVGLINIAPFLGGAIMQPVVGIMLEAHGRGAAGYSAQAYGSGFTVYFVSAAIALIAALFIKETMPIAPDKALP